MNENTNNNTTTAEPRKGFVFFFSWAECLEDLRPTERAAVYDALVSYAQTGIAPELKGKCKMALAFMLKDFERQDEKYQRIIERRREAGRMGGAPKGNSNASKNKQNNQIQAKTSKTSKTSKEEEVEEEAEAEVEVEVEDVKVGRADASLESVADAPTTDRRKRAFYETLKPYASTYSVSTLLAFFNYWSEPTPDGCRMRYELERTWSLPNRLRAWQSREPAKGRASPSVQREAEAAERERAYRRRLAREESEREAKAAERSGNAISYEEYLAQKAANQSLIINN